MFLLFESVKHTIYLESSKIRIPGIRLEGLTEKVFEGFRRDHRERRGGNYTGTECSVGREILQGKRQNKKSKRGPPGPHIGVQGRETVTTEYQ